MRIASFGDLHLGPTARRERFPQREDALVALSSYLEMTHDQVILVGDVYQADYGWRLGPDAELVARAKRRFPQLHKRWASPLFQTLLGNHDALGDRSQLHLSVDGVSIAYLHGHELDPISCGLGAQLTMWSVARLRESGLRRICDAFEEHLGQVGHATRMVLDGVASIIIMGHSHRRACMRIGDGVYANSGVCCAGSLTFVSVDTEHWCVELCDFIPDQGARCMARAVLPG
jgi:predicted phosphodiesterase